jgi:hypothetical protein
MAHYDKTVSMDVLKAAIDELYGKWAVAHFTSGPLMLWRVESEKFSIQLSDTNERWAKLVKLKGGTEEVGTKTVVYVAFQPPRKCSFP